MEPPIIEMEEVSFAYNGQPVLQEVSLAIPRGDFVAVIGPNGGGKTTLLRLMLGLLKPDTGRIRILGQAAGRATHHIGYVRQDVHINQNFPISALDVVLMGKRDPRRRWGHHGAQDRREALQALERMGMEAFAKRRIGELSRGPAAARLYRPGAGHPPTVAPAGRADGQYRHQRAGRFLPHAQRVERGDHHPGGQP